MMGFAALYPSYERRATHPTAVIPREGGESSTPRLFGSSFGLWNKAGDDGSDL
jgi:hypothetical protein